MNNIRIEFKETTVENLQAFSEILKKDINTMLEEALEQYFQSEQEKLMEKNQDDENAMTNLDFDEFWDDVDIWAINSKFQKYILKKLLKVYYDILLKIYMIKD